MQHISGNDTRTIIEDTLGELNVTYDFDGYINAVNITVKSLELVIAGEGIEVLHLLSKKQIRAIEQDIDLWEDWEQKVKTENL